jgi:NADH-quinone oxidoreductase subunit C
MTVATSVPAEQWVEAVTAARDDGFAFFEWLAGVDEIGRAEVIRVVLVLRSLERVAETRMLSTEVPRDEPRLDTISHLFAGAGWHEREAGEMFGVEFVGGDPRRLLLAPEFEGTPLRKEEVLAARAAVPWPGAKEPGESSVSTAGPGAQAPGRRRMVPPGVPDPAVWGDRDPAAGPAAPGDVAAAAVGGRVRRRRG